MNNKILYSFLCRCLQQFTKQQREKATFYIFQRTWTIRRPIFKISFSNFEAGLQVLFGIFLTVKTNWINSNSREIRRLNIKSFLNRRCLWRCYRCSSERLPALSIICFFGCVVCVCALVCFALVCLNISLPFIQLLLFDQGTSVFYLNSHESFEMY